jgi:hypothetical protein
MFIELLVTTWNLNEINYWKIKDEPFMTNNSSMNAIFCWLIWIIYLIVMKILILFGIFFGIIFIHCIYKGEYHNLKKVTCFLCIRLYCLYSAIILGKPAEAYEIGKNFEEYQKETALIEQEERKQGLFK